MTTLMMIERDELLDWYEGRSRCTPHGQGSGTPAPVQILPQAPTSPRAPSTPPRRRVRPANLPALCSVCPA